MKIVKSTLLKLRREVFATRAMRYLFLGAVASVFCLILVNFLMPTPDGALQKTFYTAATSSLAAILAACFISGLFELYFRLAYIDLIRDVMDPIITQPLTGLSNSLSSGVLNVRNTFDEAAGQLNLLQEIRGAKRVYIIQTWMPTIITMRQQLLEMVKGGGDLRVLCLEKDADMAARRAEFISDSTQAEPCPDYAEDAASNIQSTINHIQGIKKHDGVRLYNTIPACSLCIVDDIILVGHYLVYINSVESMHLQISANSKYGKQFVEYFDKLWETSRVVE